MKANGVQITVKDNTLSYRQYQTQLPMATQSPMEIASAARHLFENNYDWHTFVRAVTVRAINLEPKFMPQQLMLFDDAARRARLEKLDDTIEIIRSRFGKWSIYSASLLDSMKTSGVSHLRPLGQPSNIYLQHQVSDIPRKKERTDEENNGIKFSDLS